MMTTTKLILLAKKIISSEDVQSYFDYTSPHSDLDLEDSILMFAHHTPIHDDAPPHQVWLQKVPSRQSLKKISLQLGEMELRVGSNIMSHFLYILLLLIWHMYIVSCHNYMYYVCET